MVLTSSVKTSASLNCSSIAFWQPPALPSASTIRRESSCAHARWPSLRRAASLRSSSAWATFLGSPWKRPVSTPPPPDGAQPASARSGRSRASVRFTSGRIIDSGPMAERVSVPRGRHAPPLEVRLGVQRERLLQAAAEVFSRSGYAEASAEAISREAGMSKATFYEHFANKEEAILALFDEAATLALGRMAQAAASVPDEPDDRVRAGLRAFVGAIAEYPAASQTLFVEIIGAGPRAMERRDAIIDAFAGAIDG